ncbi:M23 family metallopeptidase [Pengzhenrongella sp.]|jgi:murein DD-endopeptidase MepM/ murein hydrolase activator NlpD|uniref:M23 family metallopeptidase n=1 Tax=Pengzhenrongella sp. TaxID=2888820 RepID=UPI002F92D5D7
MVHPLGSVVVIGVLAGALAFGVAGSGPVPDAVVGAAARAGNGAGVPGAAAPPAAHRSSGYALPLTGDPALVHPFDAPAEPWAPGHRGVDLAGTVGQDVLAPAAGTVSFAGTVVDRGVVTVVHDDGLRSSLEPVNWSVRPGTRVRRGQVIGTIQDVAGHCAPASCLHWGVRRADVYLNPLSLLPATAPVILLPDP